VTEYAGGDLQAGMFGQLPRRSLFHISGIGKFLGTTPATPVREVRQTPVDSFD
jgi:hypothetical protein